MQRKQSLLRSEKKSPIQVNKLSDLIFSLKFVCFDNLFLFSLQPLKQRSRRNSIDLYTADYNIKLICDKAAAENQSNMNSNSNNQNQNNNNQNTNQMKMIQRSSSHIRVEDMANR